MDSISARRLVPASHAFPVYPPDGIGALVVASEDFDSRDLDDEELAALALGADVDAPLDADAVAIQLSPPTSAGALGAWYMPPPSALHLRGWRKPVLIAIVASLVVLEALGLCSVFGQVVIG